MEIFFGNNSVWKYCSEIVGISLQKSDMRLPEFQIILESYMGLQLAL